MRLTRNFFTQTGRDCHTANIWVSFDVTDFNADQPVDYTKTQHPNLRSVQLRYTCCIVCPRANGAKRRSGPKPGAKVTNSVQR